MVAAPPSLLRRATRKTGTSGRDPAAGTPSPSSSLFIAAGAGRRRRGRNRRVELPRMESVPLGSPGRRGDRMSRTVVPALLVAAGLGAWIGAAASAAAQN